MGGRKISYFANALSIKVLFRKYVEKRAIGVSAKFKPDNSAGTSESKNGIENI